MEAFDAVPECMRSRRQWVVWKYEQRKGKRTKPPFQLNGSYAQSNNPNTWTDFQQVTEASGFEGIGYVFAEGDGLVGIDLDHCLQNGELAEWAIEIVNLFATGYIENSPSGEGLHIICRGKAIATGVKKWKDESGREVGFEVYDHTSPRYLTMTGDAIRPNDPADCQAELERLYDMYFVDDEELSTPPPPVTEPQSGLKKVNLDQLAVENALAHIPADEYSVWFKVGMALKAGGYPVDLWDAWSQKSDKYETGVCGEKWNTFSPSKITISSVFYLAKQFGRQVVPVPAEENVVDINSKAKSILVQERTIPSGKLIEHSRWLGESTPHPFRLTTGGLLKCSEEKPSGDLIAGPLFVLAQTAGVEGSNHGLIIEFENIDGQFIQLPVPRVRLHEEPSILARELADLGFSIQSGREKELQRYLSNCRSSDRRVAVSQTGWAKGREINELIYVLPNNATKDGIHFQPERFNPSSNSVRSTGTLSEWHEQVYLPVSENPYGIFALLISLCGPLLKPSQLDSFGFHFWGGSSSGKTTLAQVSASVWGDGSDPADASESAYIKRWNTSVNGMEGLCSSHNDLTMILDEIGSCDARDFGKAIYDITGGQGKSVMDTNRNLKKQRSWRIALLSTGEMSSLRKIEEGKKHAKAGQLLRLIDIEVNSTVLTGREHADKLKRACSKYYGVLGPVFVRTLCENFNQITLRDNVQHELDKALQRLLSDKSNLNSVQERALKRFALCEAAGILLVHFKLIPALRSQTIRNSI